MDQTNRTESDFNALLMQSYRLLKASNPNIGVNKAWALQNIIAPFLLFSSVYQLSDSTKDISNVISFISTVYTLGVSIWYVYQYDHYEHQLNVNFAKSMFKSMKNHVLDNGQRSIDYLMVKESIEN